MLWEAGVPRSGHGVRHLLDAALYPPELPLGPALPAPSGALGGSQTGNEGRVAQILASAKVLQKRINQLNPHIVSPKQRDSLLGALRPLAIYFGELSR
jgi:hypothetical protein